MTHLCLKGIAHYEGQPVTFCTGTGFVYDPASVKRERQAQTKRRKKPVLMRFLHCRNVFHEKMTFGYRFVHACCIHTRIVGNGTRLDAGVSR